MEQTIIDISKKIARDTAVWPGDTSFRLDVIMSTAAGDFINLSTLTTSAHTATHADAPYHVDGGGDTIDQVDLFPYWGTAQVVTISKAAGPLIPDDFAAYDLSAAPRLLVRTPIGQLRHDQFPKVIPFPDPTLVRLLAEHGIILYGTDTPSMDDIESETLPGHHALIENGIAILEWLDLRAAADGLYELSALPLKIVDGDGSPVRAALRSLVQPGR